MIEVPIQSIKVFSLGTTDEIKGRSTSLDNGGIWQWKKAAIDVILRSQSIGIFTQTQHLLGKNKVFRINPKVPAELFALDKLSEKELLSKAAHESRHFTPIYEKEFLNHRAKEFKPYYKL